MTEVIVARLRTAGCVFAEDEAELIISAARSPDELERMITRRVAGLPLEQILGWAEFCGLRVAVAPGVFVPRRRTEFMVEQAILLDPRVVLDLCCGSGAVALALADRVERLEVHATDIDTAAVACARGNLAAIGPVYAGDLFAGVPLELRGRLDVITANTPYVPSDAVALMPPEARVHEPRVALDGGSDGLLIARRVSAEVTDWLAPGGSVLIETSEAQAPRLAAVFGADGLRARIATSDELGATVVIGTAP